MDRLWSWAALLFSGALAACTSQTSVPVPGTNGASISLAGFAAPPAPDYSQARAWLVLPGQSSAVDDVPPQSGLTNLQSAGPVDVFYLLPTTSNADNRTMPNVAFDDPAAYAFAVQIAKNQLTAFNGIGRIYAPLYRAVPNPTWGAPLDTVQKPLELAYRDTKVAFEFYLTHYNNGRPIVLVAHSQGDVDLFRLLLEDFDGKALLTQLVAAYIVGQPLSASFYNDYAQIRPCQTATDLGCVLDWDSFSDGTTDAAVASWAFEQYYWVPKTASWGAPVPPFATSINPLEWTNDPHASSASLDLGSMPSTLSFPAPATPQLQPLVPAFATARAGAAATYVTPTTLPPGYALSIDGTTSPATGVLHFWDFQLFWLNVRANVRDRVNAYLLARQHVATPVITSSILGSGAVGQPFRYQTTVGNTASAFAALGLPAGLAIDPVTGLISGTPSVAGTSAVVITASNAAGSYVSELALAVH
jgi:hypothetical protein